MSHFKSITILVLAGLSIASAADARPQRFYVQAGKTADVYEADYQACGQAEQAARASVPHSYYQPNAAASIGASIAEGILQGRAMAKAREACFTEKGYVLVDMTSDDVREFRKTKKEDMVAWRQAYFLRRSAELPASAATVATEAAAPAVSPTETPVEAVAAETTASASASVTN